MENFFIPFEKVENISFRSNLILVKFLKAEIPSLKVSFEEQPFSLQFLLAYLKKNPLIQAFLHKIIEKCLKFLNANKENLEIQPTKIKELFKNRHTVHSHRSNINDNVFHVYKPDAIFHEIENPSKTMGFLTIGIQEEAAKEEFDNFEINMTEENESFSKNISNNIIQNELKDFTDPQMIRFRKKNIEIIKKGIEILIEGFEEETVMIPKAFYHLLNEIIKVYENEEYYAMGFFFVECGVLRQINEEFESIDKKRKFNLDSFIRVMNKIVKDENCDEIDEFQEFANKKKEKLIEIFKSILNEQTIENEDEKKEKCELEAFLINLESVERLINYIVDNENIFQSSSQRLLKHAKWYILIIIFFSSSCIK